MTWYFPCIMHSAGLHAWCRRNAATVTAITVMLVDRRWILRNWLQYRQTLLGKCHHRPVWCWVAALLCSRATRSFHSNQAAASESSELRASQKVAECRVTSWIAIRPHICPVDKSMTSHSRKTEYAFLRANVFSSQKSTRNAATKH